MRRRRVSVSCVLEEGDCQEGAQKKTQDAECVHSFSTVDICILMHVQMYCIDHVQVFSTTASLTL